MERPLLSNDSWRTFTDDGLLVVWVLGIATVIAFFVIAYLTVGIGAALQFLFDWASSTAADDGDYGRPAGRY